MYIGQQETAEILSHLGFEVFRNFKFHWNSKDTPDSSINKNGKIKRWTDGWYGDVIDFIKELQGVSFQEAKKIVENITKLDLSGNFPEYKKPIENNNKPPIDHKYLSQFEKARRKNFNKFKKLIDALLPAIKSWNKRKELIQQFKIGYIPQSDRLMIPIFDIDNSWVTIAKYSNAPIKNLPKILFSKERNKCPFNLHSLKGTNKTSWVLITEGHKDLLNAVGNGYLAVTPGSAGDLFRDKDLQLFEGLKVLICGDFDESGFVFNERMENQLDGIAEKIKVIDWESVCALNSFPIPRESFDLTDFLELKSITSY